MIKKENILQELEVISAYVAAISNRNVYSVPGDYFETLVEKVLGRVQTSSHVVSTPFTVPEGYFNDFAFAVMQKIKASKANITYSPRFEELAQIAPLLNTIDKQEIYKVPAGYFENLPTNVLQKLKVIRAQELQKTVFEELQQIAPLLNTISKANIYSVPQGYFKNFSINISIDELEEKSIGLESSVFEELEQIAPLLNTISKQVPYSVPQGYFENFTANIEGSKGGIQGVAYNNEVFEELGEIAPLLNTVSKKNVYTVPQGYFENFAANATAQATVTPDAFAQSQVFLELEEMAPLLNTISKTGPYNVPENYFSQLSINVSVQKPTAKVIGLSRSTKRVITWLAAASFTGIIAMSGYMFWQGYNKPAAHVNFTASLSDVSDEDISNYLNSTPLPGVETIPSSVLDEQIPEPEPVIQNLSTDEIKDYLEKNSDPDEKSLSDI